jgi:protein O-mannosyl-transferase
MEDGSYSFLQKILPPTILSIITTIFYYPSLWYGFMFDDLPTITQNFHVINKTNKPLDEFFANNRWISRFLNKFTYKYWQTNTFAYRIFNLALHISIGILIFFLLLKIFSSFKKSNFLKQHAYLLSILTSGLFLLHPVQTQTATYITQIRLEGLVVFFTFSVLLTFIYAVKTSNIYLKTFLYLLSFALTAFAAGTKEIIVVLPLLILLVDWFFLAQGDWKKFFSRGVIHIIFWTTLFGTFAKFNWHPPTPKEIAKIEVENNRGNILTTTPEEKIKPVPYFISQFKVLQHYFFMFFWPLNIAFDYDYRLSKSFWDSDTIYPFLVMLSIVLLSLFLFIKNRTNIISFCIAWFFITILPRASFIPSTELVCDYKTYVSSFGMMLLIAVFFLYLIKSISYLSSAFAHSKKQSHYKLALTSLLIILSGFATKSRNLIWSSELAFWEDAVKKAPTKARLYNNYAVSLAEAGRVPEAMEVYKKASQLDPTYAEPVINLAFHYQFMGKNDIALKYYEKALHLKEMHPQMYNNLGILHLNDKHYPQAENCFKTAIKLRPYHSKAHYHLARTYQDQNKLEAAAHHYKLAYQGDLPDIDSCYLHGAISFQLQKYDEAIESLEEVKRLHPNYKNAVFLLANCYYNQRNYSNATANFELVYKRDPKNLANAYNYAQSLMKQNKYEPALSLFKLCNSDQKNFPFSQLHTVKCLAELGQKEKAKEQALTLIQNANTPEISNLGIDLLKEIG